MYSLAVKRVLPIASVLLMVGMRLGAHASDRTLPPLPPRVEHPDAQSAPAARTPAGAGEATALWERFTSALRAGRFREAYECFSPASRAVFSYSQFARHYDPLTVAYEATMSPVSDSQLRVSGDLAQLRFLVPAPAPVPDARGVFMSALMVREEGSWFLVAAVREAAERTEAEARNLLQRLWTADPVQAARQEGRTLDAAALRGVPLLAGSDAALCVQAYDFSLETQAGGARLVAVPRQAGLRRFVFAGHGAVGADAPSRSEDVSTLGGWSPAPQTLGLNAVRDLPEPEPDRVAEKPRVAEAPVPAMPVSPDPGPQTEWVAAPKARPDTRTAAIRAFALPDLPLDEALPAASAPWRTGTSAEKPVPVAPSPDRGDPAAAHASDTAAPPEVSAPPAVVPAPGSVAAQSAPHGEEAQEGPPPAVDPRSAGKADSAMDLPLPPPNRGDPATGQ